ncbi:hypothetical protein [Arthrobacter methylotrophus]|uniref:hypothetical protein n=1 Tax=Arthrobacter methylotrophus TaxID=121291 RepID=UPI0031E558C9
MVTVSSEKVPSSCREHERGGRADNPQIAGPGNSVCNESDSLAEAGDVESKRAIGSDTLLLPSCPVEGFQRPRVVSRVRKVVAEQRSIHSRCRALGSAM